MPTKQAYENYRERFCSKCTFESCTQSNHEIELCAKTVESMRVMK